MVDLPGKNGDFLSFFVCLTEGTHVIYIYNYIYGQCILHVLTTARGAFGGMA